MEVEGKSVKKHSFIHQMKRNHDLTRDPVNNLNNFARSDQCNQRPKQNRSTGSSPASSPRASPLPFWRRRPARSSRLEKQANLSGVSVSEDDDSGGGGGIAGTSSNVKAGLRDVEIPMLRKALPISKGTV